MKSQGVRPAHWLPGIRVGAVRDGDRLLLHLAMPQRARIQFDSARHRRVLNFAKNYVRLNEFPEWFVVDENRLYRVASASAKMAAVHLGSELIAGIELDAGDWVVHPHQAGADRQ
jgi:hypothetical protein